MEKFFTWFGGVMGAGAKKFGAWFAADFARAVTVLFGISAALILISNGPTQGFFLCLLVSVVAGLVWAGKIGEVIAWFGKMIASVFGWVGSVIAGKYGITPSLMMLGSIMFIGGFTLSNQTIAAIGVLLILASIIVFVKKQAE